MRRGTYGGVCPPRPRSRVGHFSKLDKARNVREPTKRDTGNIKLVITCGTSGDTLSVIPSLIRYDTKPRPRWHDTTKQQYCCILLSCNLPRVRSSDPRGRWLAKNSIFTLTHERDTSACPLRFVGRISLATPSFHSPRQSESTGHYMFHLTVPEGFNVMCGTGVTNTKLYLKCNAKV